MATISSIGRSGWKVFLFVQSRKEPLPEPDSVASAAGVAAGGVVSEP